MTDLVKRLRELARRFSDDNMGCDSVDCRNAADRIERLEEELREVLKWGVVEKAPLRDRELRSIRRVLEDIHA